MIQTGCKRIFFYGADPHLEITKNRRNGYLDAMKKYKVPVDDSMIKLCDNRERAHLFGHVRNFRLWHKELTDAQLGEVVE